MTDEIGDLGRMHRPEFREALRQENLNELAEARALLSARYGRELTDDDIAAGLKDGTIKECATANYWIWTMGCIAEIDEWDEEETGHGEAHVKHGSNTVSDGSPCKPPQQKQ